MLSAKMYEVRCRRCGNIVALCNCENPEYHKVEKETIIIDHNAIPGNNSYPVRGFEAHKDRRIKEINHRKRMHPELVQPRGC